MRRNGKTTGQPELIVRTALIQIHSQKCKNGQELVYFIYHCQQSILGSKLETLNLEKGNEIRLTLTCTSISCFDDMIQRTRFQRERDPGFDRQ